MKALGVVCGIIAGFFLWLTIVARDLSGLIFVAFFGAICWFATKKANDPVRLEKIRAKKAAKAKVAAEKAVLREAKNREWALKEKERIKDRTPVAAVVVTSKDKLSTSGGLGGAVVGGLIAGPVGAVVGASAGKKTEVTGQEVTFSVRYQSGRTGVETVKAGSKRFKELAALLVK
jgi:hypothetical protein